jgi:spermidine/putrescine transport system substrate-binding protein
MARPLPEDPMIRRLVQQARIAGVSRRTVLAGAGGIATAASLAACATGGGKPKPSAAADVSATDKTLNWSNWPSYLDEGEDGGYPTLAAFQKQSGITVTYNVDIDDNNTFYAKVRDQLALGQDIGADIVCLTDWMIGRWIALGYAQKLDHARIPNIANLVPDLADPDFDPGRASSLPWQGGFGGLVWNTEKVPNGLASVDDLWSPELAGKVGVLSEMRDTIGILMLSQGVDISSNFSPDDFQNAVDLFAEKVGDGQIRNVKGNAYLEDLQNEDTLAAIVWSGDITTLNAEVGYEKWKFAIPDSGGTIWNDNLLVPIGARHRANAEELMNYYYEPEVAAEVAAWVNYITPVQGAKEAMDAIDPALASNELIFPTAQTLSTVKRFRTLSSAEESQFQAAFQAVLLG